MLDYLFKFIPVLVPLVVWAIRLETKLARIETDLKWIRNEIPKCQPSSEDHIP